MKKNLLTEIPSPRELFIETPLYHEIKMNMFSVEQFYAIEQFNETLDSYCIECEQNSVFHPKGSYYINFKNYQDSYLDDDEFEVVFECSRNNNAYSGERIH